MSSIEWILGAPKNSVQKVLAMFSTVTAQQASASGLVSSFGEAEIPLQGGPRADRYKWGEIIPL